MEAKDWHFPMACPKCGGVAGTPVRAHTEEADVLVLELRCIACQHQWAISAPAPSVFLAPKQDRRLGRR
jgi:hypothetical protein